MKIQALNGKIQLAEMERNEYLILKTQLRAILPQEVELYNAESVSIAVLKELYLEKFKSEFIPNGNKNGKITMTLTASQALALRRVPLMIKLESEGQKYIEYFVETFRTNITEAISKMQNVIWDGTIPQNLLQNTKIQNIKLLK